MNPLPHHQIRKRSFMKQLVGCFIFLVFVVGVLLLPAWHELKGNEDETLHDTCPICQVAHIPMDVGLSEIGPIFNCFIVNDPVFATPAATQISFQRDPTQARAPPAA
jgi:hypothetical protein